jgi:hypothetical protein
MLHHYRPRERVSDIDASDLAALLKRHPEYEAKVAAGIHPSE